jgi:hypothetical protein
MLNRVLRFRRRESTWPSSFLRLFGPAEPELGCDECFAQLDRFVELEVTGIDVAAAMPGLAAHLRGCGACREEHDDLLAFVHEHGQ